MWHNKKIILISQVENLKSTARAQNKSFLLNISGTEISRELKGYQTILALMFKKVIHNRCELLTFVEVTPRRI